MTAPCFASIDSFRSAFEKGLFDILKQDSLGAFILACANATFTENIYQLMKPALLERFSYWQEKLLAGELKDAPPEDISVFTRLAELGMSALEVTQYKQEGQWEIQYNQLRSFRPMRNAGHAPDSISKPFDKDGFHFNKPFMQKEVFYEGNTAGKQVGMYYNKFPFADLHLLIVPEREQEKPQFLTEHDHDFAANMINVLSENISGLVLAYNSYGASASVNHLHFQLCQREADLPVLLDGWLHNGGSESYPLTVFKYSDTKDAWQKIQSLHEAVIPYNLLYLPQQVVVIPRKMQGSYEQPDWTAGLAWYELAGGMTVSDRTVFDSLKQTHISQVLASLAA